MRNKLDLMQLNNLKVSWNSILLGLRGFDKFSGLLSTQDIIDFAIDLVTHDGSHPDEVWQIASLNVKDSDEIYQLVQRLADKEGNSQANEQRKWRALLLKQTLEELPQDHLQGLILLTDFWDRFNFPDDAPHTVQGRRNEISPTEYYTYDNYLKIVEAHKRWLSDELNTLNW
jgi:hypothetical protein